MKTARTMNNSENLISRAKNGDQAAIAELYEQTYSEAFYAVKSMIRDEDTIHDILQDSYIKAFTHLDRFSGSDGFVPWMRQIAANTARDWLKKKQPMLFSELQTYDEDDDSFEEHLSDQNIVTPEQALDESETKRLLQEILDSLPYDQRAVIGMYYYQEMSVKEIAEAMGISLSAVKSRLLYGRRKIEVQVRELEKKGTKLYGMAPIPFLLWLMRTEKVYAMEQPSAEVLKRVLQEMPSGTGSPAVSGSGKKAAETAVKTVRGFGTAKTAVIAVAAAVLLGAGYHGISYIKRQSAILTPDEILPIPAETTEIEEPAETQEPIETEIPENTEEDLTEAFRREEEAAGRIVLTGSIKTYSYEETVELQGRPDYNAEWADKTATYRIIVLDEPQEVTLQSVDGPYQSTLTMITVKDEGVSGDLDGQNIVFSIDPSTTWWKSDTSIPLGAPNVKDIHVMQ